MTIMFLIILAAVLVHLPVPAAAVVKEMHNIKDWGKPEYVHCVQPYTWHELVYGYKNGSVTFKMGGLGKMLENRGYETWQCFPDHYCAADTNNPWFCFVYHETAKVFTPWGENAQLQLVRVQGQDCPICEKKIAAAGPCIDQKGAVTMCMCAAGYYSDSPGDSCKQCPEGSFCATSSVTGTSVKPCPANSTSPAGSKNISNCTCNMGYTGHNGSCAACEAGTFKASTGTALCTAYPTFASSPVASNAATNCTCIAGYSRLNSSACVVVVPPGEPHTQTAQDPIYTLGERNEDCNEVCGSLGSGYTCDRVATSNINTQQLLIDVLANVGHIVPQTALFRSELCGGGAWEGNAPF